MNRFHHAFQIPVHWHDEVEIIYIRTGPLTIVVDGEEYAGNNGDIFFVNPGQLHLMGTDASSVDYFTLLFPLEFISFQTKDWLEEQLLFPLRNRSLAFAAMLPKGEVRASAGAILDQLITLNNKRRAPKTNRYPYLSPSDHTITC